MKTFSAKSQDVVRKWYVIDAADQIVGRVAVEAARVLRGKHKPIFTSHVDTGDFVIIVNADKAIFSGNKETQKIYTSYSGHVGGLKVETPKHIRRRGRPEIIMERAVKGMIPHNRLGSVQASKLKIYTGADHPHAAQNPEPLVIS
ncbi:MAG: 50S ribosomal protein L13 [Verrucomicrobia bacterium]|jgi:large subunit ribosomal protein L13|nr:50S ribosomal protein L13 [Verrucomicrobiota bacterium]